MSENGSKTTVTNGKMNNALVRILLQVRGFQLNRI